MVLVGKLGFQRVRSLTSRVQTGWKFEVFSTNVDCSWVRGFVGSHGVLLPENLKHVYVIVFLE